MSPQRRYCLSLLVPQKNCGSDERGASWFSHLVMAIIMTRCDLNQLFQRGAPSLLAAAREPQANYKPWSHYRNRWPPRAQAPMEGMFVVPWHRIWIACRKHPHLLAAHCPPDMPLNVPLFSSGAPWPWPCQSTHSSPTSHQDPSQPWGSADTLGKEMLSFSWGSLS